MSDQERAKPIVVLVLAIVFAIAMVHTLHRCGEVRARTAPSVTLEAKHARFTIHRDGRLLVETGDGARKVDAEIVVVEEEGAAPIAMTDLATDGKTTARAHTAKEGDITFTADAAHDALDVAFARSADAGEDERHVGLRVPLEGRAAFLAGRGDLGDLASETGRFVIVSDLLHPLGVTAAGADMHVELSASGVRTTSSISRDPKFTIAMASAGGAIWTLLYDRAKVDTKVVKGSVTGAPGVSQIVGLDDNGAPQIRVATDVAGRFDFHAPPTVTSWYASASATRTSAPVLYTPGTAWPLVLDVSDGGELHVRIFDYDGERKPITARLVVHGIDGTLDPSFGPDYRASGAGPIIDSLRGEVTTPLPAGKYRVAATKGLEWSIDTRVVVIDPGKRVDVDLSPRHVVPTPGELGADLHVHARPSFDSPVTAEDRVLSLIASGVDFAVPTEHNLVGNYAPAIKVMNVEGQLSSVPGVEITTYMPKFGHFGIFPWPTDKPPPPFKATDVNKVFAGARAGDPKRVLVVHHPRLTREIGYFTAFGWKSGDPPPGALRTDFDAIEVFNGYESAQLDRVEAVLDDWYAFLNAGKRYAATGSSDSHRVQYQWAGYPRTMVRVGATEDEERKADPLAIVAAIKAGHATVTSGPIIEFELEGARPGGDVVLTAPKTLIGRLVVRAAPWIDVTSAKIIVGGKTVETFDVPSRPTMTGPEAGALDEAAARTVRLQAEVRVEASGDPTWVVAIARGTRTLDDILPFMPIQPYAVTNPIFIHR
jgi:hypothetical protein